jgi:NAD(P)H-dependent flavin oxidoreductase YrpB (nitropropane dioxygenase family)
MKLRGDFCTTLGMRLPVVQAPIGSATTPQLVAAVSNAGGLGMLALTWMDDAEAGARIRETQALTTRPFGVNLALQWPQRGRLAQCLEAGVPVISTFWGDPAPYVELVHDAGALHIHTVGSAEEARRVVGAGVDVVVAQGWEAGGHVWGEVATFPLVPAVVEAVQPVPVLAAGGIATGRGLAAALALGAAAGWVGTRYLLASEADVHPDYQAAIAAATEADTIYGTVFDGGWPDAPHRALRNSTVKAWGLAGRPERGRRPGEADVLATTPDGTRLLRYGDDLPLRDRIGDVEPMALYAGQSTGLVHSVKPADVITRELADEADKVLAGLRGTRI